MTQTLVKEAEVENKEQPEIIGSQETVIQKLTELTDTSLTGFEKITTLIVAVNNVGNIFTKMPFPVEHENEAKLKSLINRLQMGALKKHLPTTVESLKDIRVFEMTNLGKAFEKIETSVDLSSEEYFKNSAEYKIYHLIFVRKEDHCVIKGLSASSL